MKGLYYPIVFCYEENIQINCLNLSLTGLSQLLHDIFEHQGEILMLGFCCCFFNLFLFLFFP